MSKKDPPAESGWIKLHRSSFENQLYFQEPFTRWQAWCDLLLLANHKEGFFRIRGIKVVVGRGQVGHTSVKLANRWRWSRGKVNRFLDELEDEQQIVQQKNNVSTLLSIVNYELYQSSDTANETAKSTANDTANGQQIGQQTDTNKNVKNNKEESKQTNQGGVPPPLPSPESVPGYHYLPEGRSYISKEQFYRPTDFNGLPSDTLQAVQTNIRVIKNTEIPSEELKDLWEGWKVLNLTCQKPYANREDVYRHFSSHCLKQSFLKKRAATPVKSKKDEGKYKDQVKTAIATYKPSEYSE